MKKILFLYAEIMPYNLEVFRVLIKLGYSLKVVQLDNAKLTPYSYEGEDGVIVKNISEYKDYNSFFYDNSANDIDLVFMSEKFNMWYWKLARYHKNHTKVPVVLGSDAQWTGSRNNYIKKIVYPLTYGRVFTHVQSAGLWQVVYALKIGFKRSQIITPLYCANNNLYYTVNIEKKEMAYPKRFLFVGRMHEVKGIREIVDVWEKIEDKKGWKLTMIGNGPLEEEMKKVKDIDLYPFMQQEDICKIMQESGCSLIPSHSEPWGLVIHEAAAAGMPIIVSKDCGATNKFVIDGYNGFCIKGGNAASLESAMRNVINNDKETLIKMSKRSRQLAQGLLPEHVAYALISVINNN